MRKRGKGNAGQSLCRRRGESLTKWKAAGRHVDNAAFTELVREGTMTSVAQEAQRHERRGTSQQTGDWTERCSCGWQREEIQENAAKVGTHAAELNLWWS